MALTDHKINGETPVKNFPGTYNGLIDELTSKISELESIIASKDQEIRNLKNQMTNLNNSLRAEFGNWFDQKMTEFENRFVKKTEN